MHRVKRRGQITGVKVGTAQLNEFVRCARALRLRQHVVRVHGVGRPDNDGSLATLELLDDAFTKRFSRNQIRIPPDGDAFLLELLRESTRELPMRPGIADKYVRHRNRPRSPTTMRQQKRG